MNHDQLAKLIIPDSGQQFKGNDLRQLMGPGVYVLIEEEVVLYVGVGKNILRRISSKHHQKAAFETCDKLLLYPCVSYEAALELERLLIFSLKPLRNSRQHLSHLQRLMGIGHKHNIIQYAQ